MLYKFTLSYELSANSLIHFRVKGGLHDSYETTVAVSLLEIESFFKKLSNITMDSKSNALSQKDFFTRFFFRLKKIIFICEVAKFTHPSLEESLTIYLAKEKSGKSLFYIEAIWFAREKIFFVDYSSTKRTFEDLMKRILNNSATPHPNL